MLGQIPEPETFRDAAEPALRNVSQEADRFLAMVEVARTNSMAAADLAERCDWFRRDPEMVELLREIERTLKQLR